MNPRLVLLLLFAVCELHAAPPNIVMIAVDDLNDWVGCLGGHPQARTPHIDRLSKRGVLFTNAHCISPLCGPSRTAVFTGLRPHQTGIYDNNVWFRDVERLRDIPTLPRSLAAGGYKTVGIGKLFHTSAGDGMPKSEFQHTAKRGWANYGPFPDKPFNYHDKVSRLRDWAAWPPTDEENADHVIANRAISFLKEKREPPFFLAVGFFRPHAPFYASPKWHALHPRDTLKLPPVKAGDLEDVPPPGRAIMTRSFDPAWVRENGKAAELVQAYLAAVSFVDAQVGRVLDAIDASPHRDNTVIVLWSDHGFHLGEKDHFGKTTLWERASHVPLIFAGAGIAPDARCTQPVSLLDLYPTLLALGQCDPRPGLPGMNLTPLLRDQRSPCEQPALITYQRGNHAVRSEQWRYIRYADGSEELYDLKTDPNEWTNLASRPEHAATLAAHRRWLPEKEAAPARKKSKASH
jgi:arylsulfatase A-like enzyme